jgi:hypothetical protein
VHCLAPFQTHVETNKQKSTERHCPCPLPKLVEEEEHTSGPWRQSGMGSGRRAAEHVRQVEEAWAVVARGRRSRRPPGGARGARAGRRRRAGGRRWTTTGACVAGSMESVLSGGQRVALGGEQLPARSAIRAGGI